MADENNVMFGYVDDQDEQFKAKEGGSGGVFGLNVATLEYCDFDVIKSSKDDSESEAFRFEAKIGERSQRLLIFDPTGQDIYVGKDRVSPQDEETYMPAFRKQMIEHQAAITHIVKGLGATDQAIKNALKKHMPKTFADYVKILCSLITVKKGEEFHLFLEYQWKPKGNQQKTYLTIPKNMKGGSFVHPNLPVAFEMQTKEDGSAVWVATEGKNAGKEHPTFARTKNYMESPKAFSTDLAYHAEGGNNGNGGSSSGGTDMYDADFDAPADEKIQKQDADW